jgi:hypothetical protein
VSRLVRAGILPVALAMAVSLATGPGAALAAGDVGVVNHLAGYVTVTSGAGTSKAQAYMNIHEGDLFEVPAGVALKVVYFRSGRQESFSGPTSFRIGARQSAVQKGAQPVVSVLPSGVPQKISQAPELVQIAKLGRAAGLPVRAAPRDQRLTPQQQAEVRQARETYATLRAGTPDDDITPELYLYSVLQDNLLYGEMRPVVAEMARRQPGNGDVAVLAEYVKLKTEQK